MRDHGGRVFSRSTFLKGAAGAALGVGALGTPLAGAAAATTRRAEGDAPKAVATSKVLDLTGPDQTGAPFGMGATDLGVPVTTPNKGTIYFFGDTYTSRATDPNDDWRSPTALYSTTSDLNSGILWSGAVEDQPGHAKQLWAYEHTNGSTLLPADAVVLGNTIYLYAMKNEPFPTVTQTEIWKSDNDGQDWADTGFRFGNEGPLFGPNMQCLGWAPGDNGYVYFFSTKFGRAEDSKLHLGRVKADQITNRDAYEPWGWTQETGWQWGNPASPVLDDGYIGEICLRPIDGKWLLTFLVAQPGNVRIDGVLMNKPDDDLHAAYRATLIHGVDWAAEDHATGRVAQPYGGYIVPGSTLADLHLTVSQWDTVEGDNWPYRVMQFKTTGFGS